MPPVLTSPSRAHNTTCFEDVPHTEFNTIGTPTAQPPQGDACIWLATLPDSTHNNNADIIIIIIIITIILGISFMQGIYTYIPETNHVPREHSVAAILM